MTMTAAHDRISVHSQCFYGAPLDEFLGHCRDLGARGVSFNSRQLLDGDRTAIRATLDAAGQHAETIAHTFTNSIVLDLHTDLAPFREELLRVIDVAAAIGARSIYMTTGGRGTLSWHEAAALFVEGVTPCRDHACAAGVALLAENTTMLDAGINIGNNLVDTLALAEQANIGLCIDVFACWTEATVYETFRRAIPRCGVLQISDYVYGDRGLPCRAVPGDGAIPLAKLIAHALENGYQGSFDIEMMGPRIEAEGRLPATRRAMERLEILLGEQLAQA
jgi:sugar phosphate isomerase/epimerase